MYIPRYILTLLIIIYLLFLVSVDWINQPDGSWLRPYVIGFMVVCVAIWAHRRQDNDEF